MRKRSPHCTTPTCSYATKTARDSDAGKSMAFAKARDEDVYAWLLDQARRLRASKPALIDWMGFAEELDDIMAQQRAKVVSHLRVRLAHLLKWSYSRIRRSDHNSRKS